MKKTSLLILGLILSAITFAQAPNKMSFQTVVRNSQGKLVLNKSIGVRISILQFTSTGTAVYAETHSKTSNVNGLLTLEVGAGSVATGVFSTIDWSHGPYYIKTERDVNGGTNYTISGVTEFVSVPYAMNSKSAQKADTALYVKSVEKGKNIGEMNYWNGDAWVPISKGIQGQTLTYCDEKPTWTVGGICPGKIAALDCNSATNNGLIYSGRNTNVNSLLTYSGGNGGSYSTSSFTSEGVLGLVATISNSTLENGSGTLNITINGSAQSEGEALFNISFLGFNCQLKRNVMVYPATVSYLNCNTSYLVGQLTEGENATNVSGKISYMFGNDGVLSTFNVNSTGVSGLKAEIQGTKLYSDTGYYISYTITGVPGSSGTASFNLTIGGKSCVLNRVVKGKVVLVTFNANGGEVSVNSQTVTSGSVYGVLPTPTRTGYTFEGWELNAVKVTSQTVISTILNHTLIAKWTGNSYLVSFDANGGSVSTISKNAIFGSAYGELPVPTKTGYTFTGWDLNGGYYKFSDPLNYSFKSYFNSSVGSVTNKWLWG